MPDLEIDRRAFLIRAGSIGFSVLAAPNVAAQQTGASIRSEVDRRFRADFGGMIASFDSPPTVDQVLQYAAFDVQIRQDIYVRIVESGTEPVTLVVEDLTYLPDEMGRFGVRLIPTREYITVEIPAVVPPVGEAATPDDRTKVAIIMSILLETLGVVIDGDVIQEFLDSEPELSSELLALLPALKEGDWERLQGICDFVLKKVFEAEVLRKILRFLGPDDAARLLFKSSVRFIPIVGWGYTALCFFFALKRNWQLLTA